MQVISKVLIALAITALTGCQTYRDTVPAWMPGSGAISVKLSGAEEVPPVSTPGSGSGSFRVAEDGTKRMGSRLREREPQRHDRRCARADEHGGLGDDVCAV